MVAETAVVEEVEAEEVGSDAWNYQGWRRHWGRHPEVAIRTQAAALACLADGAAAGRTPSVARSNTLQ